MDTTHWRRLVSKTVASSLEAPRRTPAPAVSPLLLTSADARGPGPARCSVSTRSCARALCSASLQAAAITWPQSRRTNPFSRRGPAPCLEKKRRPAAAAERNGRRQANSVGPGFNDQRRRAIAMEEGAPLPLGLVSKINFLRITYFNILEDVLVDVNMSFSCTMVWSVKVVGIDDLKNSFELCRVQVFFLFFFWDESSSERPTGVLVDLSLIHPVMVRLTTGLAINKLAWAITRAACF
ncbi:hypothetical protein SEVIR_2G416032v4 [Setaria viridis]